MKFHLPAVMAVSAVALLGPSAMATSLTVNVTAGPITHEFFGTYSVDHITGSYYDAAEWPSIRASLSNYDSLVLRISAPEGSMFEVTGNGSSIGKVFSLGSAQWAADGYTGRGITTFLPTSLTFEGWDSDREYTGTYFQLSGDKKRLTTGGSVSVGGAFNGTFSAIVYTIDLSVLPDVALPTFMYKPNEFGLYMQDILRNSLPRDPGPSITLTSVITSSVPEPSTFWLMGLGGIVILAATRRLGRAN